MDPPLVNEASFMVGSNPSSYSLVELLSFPMGGAGSLGLTMGSFGGGDGSIEESTVTDQSGNGGRKRRKEDNHDMNESNGKIIKASASRDEDGGSKTEAETNSGTSIKIIIDKNKPEPPKDYIHVRARKGQATDSHSLAERARREKISERMKILQDLVPGCNKVIGKALVLDEIINYIQSLQSQVEFMSMKLEAVNSRMNLTMEGFPAKDLLASSLTFDAGGMIFGSQGPTEYSQGTTPQQAAEWLHMQLGTAFDRPT